MRLVIARGALVLAVLAGCGKQAAKPQTSCADAAQRGIDAMIKRQHERIDSAQLPDDVRAKMAERMKQVDELAPRLRAVIANRCVDDKWPAAVIDCYAQVTSIDDMRKCRSQLTAEQQAKIEKQELDLMSGTSLGPPGFGSAAAPPPTSPDVQQLEAELRDVNTKLADAVRRAAEATTDAAREDAKRAVQTLQEQIKAVNEKLEAARARAAAPAPGPSAAP